MADKYRLEYSEKQGCFHFEVPEINNKNTNGYDCLCSCITEKQCFEFTKKMIKKYPMINSGCDGCPTADIMKKEFEAFLLS